MESWTKALDRGESIDVAYLDFMKAFDTVPHKRLIGKLKIILYAAGGMHMSKLRIDHCKASLKIKLRLLQFNY